MHWKWWSVGFKINAGRGCAAVAISLLLMTQVWASSKEKVLYTFSGGADGANPYASLVSDAAGNLYGTTPYGGAYGSGTVFQLSPTITGPWTETVLYSFTGGSDGSIPYADVIFDKAGYLYGTTYEGGTSGCGVVFKLAPTGSTWAETVLYSFLGAYVDGQNPFAGLAIDPGGNLYGTTEFGGGSDWGSVFELARNNGTWTETILWGFSGGDANFPMARVLLDPKGHIYGTGYGGGNEGYGAVFKLVHYTGGWSKSVPYTFTSCCDGHNPVGGLVLDSAGNVYGTTFNSGIGHGVAFELTPTNTLNWLETRLYTFTGGSDGGNPYAGLVFDTSGNLYGTTEYGGAFGYGTVYKLTPTTTGFAESVLYSFTGGKDGGHPLSGLLLRKGVLYGTTEAGGSFGQGVVYEVQP